MDTAVFYEVVVPLLELDNTALICISTILDSFNFYSKLLELKDENGDPFFVQHTFVMACEQCQADGTPEKCTHMFHALPPWQSERKHLKYVLLSLCTRLLHSPRRPVLRIVRVHLIGAVVGRRALRGVVWGFLHSPRRPVLRIVRVHLIGAVVGRRAIDNRFLFAGGTHGCDACMCVAPPTPTSAYSACPIILTFGGVVVVVVVVVVVFTRIRAMMADQQELLARETMGLQSDTYARAFKARDLIAFRTRPLYPPPRAPVRHLIMAVDPSGGGSKSHFAVVTCYWDQGHVVVAGLESVPARRPEDYEQCLRVHLARLRAAWPHAVVAVCPEANLGFESSHIARCVRSEKFVVVMYEASQGCPGLCTTHKVKEVIHGLLADKLRDNAVSMAANLVTSTDDPARLRKMLVTQVQNYSVVVDEPDRLQHFKFSKKTYSGKHHGPDDMAMMLQFCLLARRRFVTNAKYRPYW